jgi:hypothetical protein
MLKANGFLAVRVALVMGLVLICLLWAAAKSGEGQVPSVDGPDGLRKELWESRSLCCRAVTILSFSMRESLS